MEELPRQPPAGGPEHPEDQRFRALLERARARDPEALAELLSVYQAELHRMASRKLGPGLRRDMDSMDLSQTVVREVLRDLPGVKAEEPTAFRAWLHKLMENKLRNKSRDAKRLKRDGGPLVPLAAADSADSSDAGIEPAAAGPSPGTEAFLGERAERVRLAVAGLPPDLRRVVELKVFEGFTWDQISAATGLSQKAAQGAWDRARLRLGRRLDA